MGAKISCPCLEPIAKVLKKDNGPSIRQIRRPSEGSWQPSPAELPVLPAYAFATPVPRSDAPKRVASGDFEMVCQDLDSDSGPLSSSKKAALRSKFEVEQLLASPGNLPNIKQVAHPSQMTETAKLISQVPQEFLEARGQHAQDLRRRLLRGATVVFASAGYPGKRFIFERAAALGVKSVIIDHPDSWSRGLVDEGIVAKFLPVDMSASSDEIFQQAETLIHTLGQDGLTGPVDAITTFVELSVPLASRLSASFGLPGMSPEAVDAARDKHQTRAALKRAGLPTPRNSLVRSEGDLAAAGKLVGFPAVLKPVSGAASLGVKKVASFEELLACYREVVAELSSLVVSSGALVKADGTGKGVKATEAVDLTVLLEQYLDGQEVDVDIVMSEGQWQYAAVSDNGPTMEPYFNETWGLSPSLLAKEKQAELKDLAVSCVTALGFESGVFHVECKYTTTGPQLIEVNARMGGGPVRECNRLVWGADLVEEAIYCALGIPARPLVPSVPNTCIGYTFVNSKRSGTIQSTKCFEDLRGRPGVLSSDALVKPGDAVVGPADGLPTWLCLLVVSKASPEEALKYVMELEDGVLSTATIE